MRSIPDMKFDNVIQWVIPKSVLSDERRAVLETTNRVNAMPIEFHVEKSHQTNA
jgi:hypothetical protein